MRRLLVLLFLISLSPSLCLAGTNDEGNYGVLRVICEHENAAITVNGKHAGTGDYFLDEVPPGKYAVECRTREAKGAATVTVGSGQATVARVHMTYYGKLLISCKPKNSRIRVDHHVTKGNPVKLSGLDAGSYHVKCDPGESGHDPYDFRVSLDSEETKRIDISLHKNMQGFRASASKGFIIGSHGGWATHFTSELWPASVNGNTVSTTENGYYRPSTSNMLSADIEVGVCRNPNYFLAEWVLGYRWDPSSQAIYFNVPVLAFGWYEGRLGYRAGLVDRVYLTKYSDVGGDYQFGLRWLYVSMHYFVSQRVRLDFGMAVEGHTTEQVGPSHSQYYASASGSGEELMMTMSLNAGLTFYGYLFDD